MQKLWQFTLLSAMLVASTQVAANAQSFNFFSRPMFRHDSWRMDHRFDRWRVDGMDRRFDRARVEEINRRVAHVRFDINRSLAQGLISPERAARLNARLDNIVASERDMSFGGLNTDELWRLNARLDNVESAARGGGGWY